MIPPFPFRQIIAALEGAAAGIVTVPWQIWLRSVTDALNAASQRMAVVTLAAQSATIGATALLPDTGSAGLFRVSWFLRVTQAATTSSSVAVTIGFTEGSVALTTSGAALTGNTTTTFQQGTLMLACDANSSITYAASYSSVGATSMQYGLAVIVERVNG